MIHRLAMMASIQPNNAIIKINHKHNRIERILCVDLVRTPIFFYAGIIVRIVDGWIALFIFCVQNTNSRDNETVCPILTAVGNAVVY